MLDWIILECLNCDVDRARETNWRSEAALIEPASPVWRPIDQRRFTTRRECLRALRRGFPESDWSAPDDAGQINKTTHYPDYVQRFSAIPAVMNSAQDLGCFSAAQVALR